MAENIAESLHEKGTRVIVQGRLVQRSFETREGEKRTVVEMQVDEVGPSLRYATAKVARKLSGQQSGQWGASARVGEPRQHPDAAADDPWATNATAGTNYSDTPPF